MRHVWWIIAGAISGLVLSWMINHMREPWIKLTTPDAIYTPHDKEVTITAHYIVNDPCDSSSTWHYLVILWDGEVLAFTAPSLRPYDIGPHEITDQFLWPDNTDDPHGAIVRVVSTCLTETPSILISLGGNMRFMDLRGLPAKPEDFVAVRRPRTANPG